MKIDPYLNFSGDCEAAFKFYEKSFRGQIEALYTYGSSPMAEHFPKDWHDKIMHACLKVNGQLIMGSDVQPERFDKPQGFAISLNITEPAEAERVFADLADGGTVEMALEETFWAKKFGMVTDRFGIPWMINCGEKAM